MIRLFMGKRLTCPRCGSVNEYDVPVNEATATLREVRCRPCGHRFNYGFQPEYVTEAEAPASEQRAVAAPYDRSAETVLACERLSRHVARYSEYSDRDRDILLLHLLDVVDHMDDELSAIKRVLDVVVKRSAVK